MMKRILALTLALLLALSLLPAQAEELDALYRIVRRTEAGDVTLGTGVLFGSQQALLTVRGCMAEGDLYAVGADGEHPIDLIFEVTDSQLVLMRMETESAAKPLNVTEADVLLDDRLHGAGADGSIKAQEIAQLLDMVIDQRSEVLLPVENGPQPDCLLPGAIMLGADGGLACITVWQQGEGQCAYAAIADVTLGLLRVREAEDEGAGSLLHGFTVRAEDGLIRVDWSDAGETVPEHAVVAVYLNVVDNPYLSYDLLTEGETGTEFPAIPGTGVQVWIAVSDSEPTEPVYPQTMADVVTVEVPEAGPFTLHGFRNLRLSVTPGEKGLGDSAVDFLPQHALDRAALTDRTKAIYFQTEDAYSVTEEDSGHVLLLTLHTPEGFAIPHRSGYTFMPELSGSDLWVSDISDVFEKYERFTEEGSRWPAGEYAVVYTIDGQEAGRYTFTLE